MSRAPELARLVSALGTAQAQAVGTDRATATAALRDLEEAWARCPATALDAFDRANIQLCRATLQQLLDLDASAAVAEALRLARQAGPDEEDQRLLVQVLLEAGDHARRAGDFDAARPLLDEALQRARTALGPLDEETAQAWNGLGLWGRYRGELDLARDAYAQSLRIVERAPHPRLHATVLHNLASLEHLAGRPEPALNLIETALRLREDGRDEAGRDADDAVRAAVLIDLGRYPQAAGLFRLLSIRLSRRWGPDSTEMLHLNANWAVLEQQQGNLAAARERYARAVTAAERHYGPEHPETGAIHANAAHLAHSCGDRAAAEDHLRRALLALQGSVPGLPSLRLAHALRAALAS